MASAPANEAHAAEVAALVAQLDGAVPLLECDEVRLRRVPWASARPSASADRADAFEGQRRSELELRELKRAESYTPRPPWGVAADAARAAGAGRVRGLRVEQPSRANLTAVVEELKRVWAERDELRSRLPNEARCTPLSDHLRHTSLRCGDGLAASSAARCRRLLRRLRQTTLRRPALLGRLLSSTAANDSSSSPSGQLLSLVRIRRRGLGRRQRRRGDGGRCTQRGAPGVPDAAARDRSHPARGQDRRRRRLRATQRGRCVEALRREYADEPRKYVGAVEALPAHARRTAASPPASASARTLHVRALDTRQDELRLAATLPAMLLAAATWTRDRYIIQISTLVTSISHTRTYMPAARCCQRGAPERDGLLELVDRFPLLIVACGLDLLYSAFDGAFDSSGGAAPSRLRPPHPSSRAAVVPFVVACSLESRRRTGWLFRLNESSPEDGEVWLFRLKESPSEEWWWLLLRLNELSGEEWWWWLWRLNESSGRWWPPWWL